MVMKNLGGTREHSRPAGGKPRPAHMTKSERLHRWAANLELQEQLELIDDAGPRTRDQWFSTRADSSPLAVAFEDWAFQAEGLRSDRVGDALAFFDLSEDEMKPIVGSSGYRRRAIPATVAARRVRELAEQTESTTLPQLGLLVSGACIAAALGLALVAS
jgi:hypothetical protein